MLATTETLFFGDVAISNWCESEGVLGPANLRVSQVSYVKRYVQKLHGVGEVQLQYCYRANGHTEFRGYELFTGAIDNDRGSFIASINGYVDKDSRIIRAELEVNSGSGSADLHAVSGLGSYLITDSGYCSYECTLLV